MDANNVCSSAIVAQVLNGASNYENWKACVQNYLWVRDLWDVVEQTPEPPQQEDKAEFKGWSKRNVAALHAIQISCDPIMLSSISNMTTAKDAWNTLAQMCQLPIPEEAPVAEFIDRTHMLELLKAIKECALESTKGVLTSHTHLANTVIGDSSFAAFHFAIFKGQLDMIDEFLSTMSEEHLKMQDRYGRTVLHHAAMSENTKIAQSLIRKNRELLTFPDSGGNIPLNSACWVGHKDMTHYLYNMTSREFLLSPGNECQAALFVCDCINNKWFDVALNLLCRHPHLAFVEGEDGISAITALSCQPSAFPSGSGFSFWQRWIYSFCPYFEARLSKYLDNPEVEGVVPPMLKKHKNEEGETPYEAFDQSHARLLKEGEKWMKDIAQSSMIVGTLIITIMFATLFTIPGGLSQDTGVPFLLTKKLVKVFIISDAISLFASTTSVLMFVGILTSRYTTHDFLKSLPNKLMIGLSSLFISIATMMVAFSSTAIIMLKGQLEIVIPIVLLASIPIGLFVWLQFPLLVKIFISTYGLGIFDRKMKKWL
ncbi:Ankyrin repeat family protein [Theobroma cacao]|uniref:Ankyrin repeat family protein n=1 Tax=Theobroma cacao TaxID=3641 RepID=A0A061FV93_THECC|nr:Ankyrin repeat family protein [Theobroma cacao]